jgi:hypothetical protein
MTDTTAHLVSAGTRKVHLAFAWQPEHPTCNRADTVTTRHAVITGEGLEGTIAALTGADVTVSRLCKNCFPIRTRRAYAAARAR